MKKLAILGASYLQKPLIEKANIIGVETHCFAWDNDEAICKNIADFYYPISVLEKELILEKCQEIQINGITTIATDICIPTICYVADKMNLISNTYDSAIRSTNKGKMRESFSLQNVSSPKSTTINAFENKFLSNFEFPLIVKPTDRSGSRGVTKVYSKDELKNAIARALDESIEKSAVVEEFIDGVEVSVESISWQGKHFILAITDKVTTGEPYFVELEHHQPSKLDSDIQEKIKDETFKALKALQIEYGASHSEFKITKEGKVYAIEVGARMGGDFIGSNLVELSTGYDFLKGVINVALNQFEKPLISFNNCSGVYFLSNNTSNLLSYFNKKNQFEVLKEILNMELKDLTNSNDRSGYLIYQSSHKINLS